MSTATTENHEYPSITKTNVTNNFELFTLHINKNNQNNPSFDSGDSNSIPELEDVNLVSVDGPDESTDNLLEITIQPQTAQRAQVSAPTWCRHCLETGMLLNHPTELCPYGPVNWELSEQSGSVTNDNTNIRNHRESNHSDSVSDPVPACEVQGVLSQQLKERQDSRINCTDKNSQNNLQQDEAPCVSPSQQQREKSNCTKCKDCSEIKKIPVSYTHLTLPTILRV